MPKEYQKVTEVFVCGLIGVVLMYVLWRVVDPITALVVGGIVGFEAWTLVNKRPNDTISEIIWRLRRRSLVPFLFGCASIAMIALGWFGPWREAVRCAAWFMVMGHFFFPPETEEL